MVGYITGSSYILSMSAWNTLAATFLFSFMVGVKMSFSTVNGSLSSLIYFGLSRLLNLFAIARLMRLSKTIYLNS